MFGSFQPLKKPPPPHQIPSTSRQSPAGDEDPIEDIIPPTDSDEEGAPIINIIHPLLRIRKIHKFLFECHSFFFTAFPTSLHPRRERGYADIVQFAD